MAHAEKCPICFGLGKISDDISTNMKRQCHGCYGVGWITVTDASDYWQPWGTITWEDWDGYRYTCFVEGNSYSFQ